MPRHLRKQSLGALLVTALMRFGVSLFTASPQTVAARITGGSSRRVCSSLAFANQSGRWRNVPSVVGRGPHHTAGAIVWQLGVSSPSNLQLGYNPIVTRCFSSRNHNGSAQEKDDWKVPDYVSIPEDRLEFNFVRSSGAGGQNVNKVNTQVQIRFHVESAYWLPPEVRQRLQQQQSNRINKDGYLAIAAQEHRTQVANRKQALSKLQTVVLEAWARPKERNMRVGLSPQTKRQRRDDKRRRSQVKQGRRRVDF